MQLSQLLKSRDLIAILTRRNLTIRYKGSALGFFWSLLTPALTILMYAVFARILKFNNGQPHYLQFLVVGIIVWQLTVGTLNDSLFAIAGNSNLVKKVYFPRVILPLTTALANMVNFLLTCVPLVLYLALTSSLCATHIFWILPAMFFHFLLCIGIACFIATLNVFYKDVQHVVGIGQLAWFFLTPVFYGIDMQISSFPSALGAHVSPGIVFLNPMTGIVCMYRKALMGLEILPADSALSPWYLALSGCVCLAVFAIGLKVLNRGDKSFGDVL